MLESESEHHEAQVNLTEATEDLNQVSEEPTASYAQEGKPGACPIYFKFMQLLIFLSICAFKFVGIVWNPSCIILSTYV